MKQYEFFFGAEDPCSNFYPVEYFDARTGHTYVNSEQSFMYEKAMYFEDEDIARKILLMKDPKHIKAAGKLVKGFDPALWDLVCVEKMILAVRPKFKVPDLHEYMLERKGVTFVEASPFDRKWGIGLSRFDAIRTPESMWPGKNLLGKVLNYIQYEIMFWESVRGG